MDYISSSLDLFGSDFPDAEHHFVSDVEEGTTMVGDGQEHVDVLGNRKNIVH